MYTLFRNASLGEMLTTHAPAILISLVVAELFFKWKSFALECLGFLALWFVLDASFAALRTAWLKWKLPAPGAPQ
jgi:NADH:ubiquinone oxidoreductase subunit H